MDAKGQPNVNPLEISAAERHATSEASKKGQTPQKVLKNVVGGLEVTERQCWMRLREYLGISDDFLASETIFSFAKCLRASDGKSGAMLGFSFDKRFIVKELSQEDHTSLLALSDDFISHLTTGHSLLAPFLMHFTLVEAPDADHTPPSKSCCGWTPGQEFVVMLNVSFIPGIKAKHWSALMDIKGCQDDKSLVMDGVKVPVRRKRWYHVHRWSPCCWDRNRLKYWESKHVARNIMIGVTSDQHSFLSSAIERDTQFLTSHNLMDYSVLLGVLVLPQNANGCATAAVSPDMLSSISHSFEDRLSHRSGLHHVNESTLATTSGGDNLFPFCAFVNHYADDHVTVVVSCGIIDILQRWNCRKGVANGIKVCERNKSTVPPGVYGRRFYRRLSTQTFTQQPEVVPFDPTLLADTDKKEDSKRTPPLFSGLAWLYSRYTSVEDKASRLHPAPLFAPSPLAEDSPVFVPSSVSKEGTRRPTVKEEAIRHILADSMPKPPEGA